MYVYVCNVIQVCTWAVFTDIYMYMYMYMCVFMYVCIVCCFIYLSLCRYDCLPVSCCMSILRPPDELFQQLDDNQVTLSTMKASRFVKAFEKEVDYWERTLSLILEVIEMILQVQRQWMYLEVIKD